MDLITAALMQLIRQFNNACKDSRAALAQHDLKTPHEDAFCQNDDVMTRDAQSPRTSLLAASRNTSIFQPALQICRRVCQFCVVVTTLRQGMFHPGVDWHDLAQAPEYNDQLEEVTHSTALFYKCRKPESPVFTFRTIGDGNCLWRAASHSLRCTWFSLKRKVLRQALSRKDERHSLVKQLAKPNAWGNALAIQLIAEYLNTSVYVWHMGGIGAFHPPTPNDSQPIFLALAEQHFEAIPKWIGYKLLKSCDAESPTPLDAISFATQAIYDPLDKIACRSIRWQGNKRPNGLNALFASRLSRFPGIGECIGQGLTYEPNNRAFTPSSKKTSCKKQACFLSLLSLWGRLLSPILYLFTISCLGIIGDSHPENAEMNWGGAPISQWSDATQWNITSIQLPIFSCTQHSPFSGGGNCYLQSRSGHLQTSCRNATGEYADETFVLNKMPTASWISGYSLSLKTHLNRCDCTPCIGAGGLTNRHDCGSPFFASPEPYLLFVSSLDNFFDDLRVGGYLLGYLGFGDFEQLRLACSKINNGSCEIQQTCFADDCSGTCPSCSTSSKQPSKESSASSCKPLLQVFDCCSFGLTLPWGKAQIAFAFCGGYLCPPFTPNTFPSKQIMATPEAAIMEHLLALEQELVRLRNEIETTRADEDEQYKREYQEAYDTLREQVLELRAQAGETEPPLPRKTKRQLNQSQRGQERQVSAKTMAKATASAPSSSSTPARPKTPPTPPPTMAPPVTPPSGVAGQDVRPVAAKLPAVAKSPPVKAKPTTPPLGPRTSPKAAKGMFHRLLLAKPASVPSSSSSSASRLASAETAEPDLPKSVLIESCGFNPNKEMAPSRKTGTYDVCLKVDLREYWNPEASKSLRRHTGRHPTTLSQFVRTQDAQKLIAAIVQNLSSAKRAYIEVGCSQGRHRSVALTEVLTVVLPLIYEGISVETFHRGSLRNWHTLCKPWECHQRTLLGSARHGAGVLERDIKHFGTLHVADNATEHKFLEIVRDYMADCSMRCKLLLMSFVKSTCSLKVQDNLRALSILGDAVEHLPGLWGALEHPTAAPMQHKCLPASLLQVRLSEDSFRGGFTSGSWLDGVFLDCKLGNLLALLPLILFMLLEPLGIGVCLFTSSQYFHSELPPNQNWVTCHKPLDFSEELDDGIFEAGWSELSHGCDELQLGISGLKDVEMGQGWLWAASDHTATTHTSIRAVVGFSQFDSLRRSLSHSFDELIDVPQMLKQGAQKVAACVQYFVSLCGGFSGHPATSTHPSLDDFFRDDDDDEHDNGTLAFSGGGKDPNKPKNAKPTPADISKQLQRVKTLEHGLAPKQLRMLLVSDQKFFRKIERSQNEAHLVECIGAAAARMGLVTQAPPNRLHRDPKPEDKPPGKGNPNPKPSGKGKGKGKAKGKADGDAPPNTRPGAIDFVQTSKKGKGKGKAAEKSSIRYEIVPDGWNVLPTVDLTPSRGGIYAVEKDDDAKQIAEAAAGLNFPVGLLAPRPLDIGVKEPLSLMVEFYECQNDTKHIVTMRTYLHQLTSFEACYNRNARAVTIDKPDVAKTQVVYIKFTDLNASTQTKIDLKTLKPFQAKAWLQTLLQEKGPISIVDLWNLQEIGCDQGIRQYSISVRVPTPQLQHILAASMPGRVQTNVPNHLRDTMAHVWLKGAEGPFPEDKVKDIAATCPVPHLGCFVVRGTWALRVEAKNLDELKKHIGKTDAPSYLISGCTGDWDADDVREIAKKIGWDVEVRPNDHKWKRGGRVWVVRATMPPPIIAFPVNFGYQRLQLHIQSTKRPHAPTQGIQERPTMPVHRTWHSQMRKPNIGVAATRKPTFKDILLESPNPKRRCIPSPAPSPCPMMTGSIPPLPAQRTQTEAAPSGQSLNEQLLLLQQQNQQQQQQIGQLLEQIAQLTSQLSVLAANAANVPVAELEDMTD